MKKVFAVAAMLVTMAGAASAQGGGGGGGGGGAQMTPEQMLERNMTRLFKDITLTDAVKTKAEAIIKEAMEASGKIADRRSPEGMAKNQEITKKRNEDLKELLKSDADKKQFDTNAAAPGGRRGGF
jgi:Spy/CpxP family protein refolding chaperone